MKVRLKLIAVFLWVISTSSLSVAGQTNDCLLQTLNTIFKSVNRDGTSYEADLLKNYLPGYTEEFYARKLGQGGNGRVFRIISKVHPEKTFVLKVTTADQAMNDYVAFEMLKEVSEGQSFVKIPRVKYLPPVKNSAYSLTADVAIEFEDIHGKDLFEVLVNEKIPSNIRHDLREKYLGYVHHITKKLESNYGLETDFMPPLASAFPSHLPKNSLSSETRAMLARQPNVLFAEQDLKVFFKKNPELLKRVNNVSDGRATKWFEPNSERDLIQILIKSDNFIVTRDFDLYLVDPY